MNAERAKFFGALGLAGAMFVAASWGVLYGVAYVIQFLWELFVR